jgi:hypothetical protein
METNSKKILQQWEDELSESLVEGFRHLFESSSQVLLEFADAAENNRLQRLFFDAQREFYLKEELIVSEFRRNLHESMLAFTTNPATSTQLGADTLSLVEVEDYERSLALETIAKRTVDRQLNSLHHLAQRLSAVLGGRPIPTDQVPGNPMQIIRIFDPASRKLEVEKEVRLVFYTLFDRFVMSRLGELYDGFNQRLIDMGILPNIKFEYQHSDGGTASRAAADQATDSDQAESDEGGSDGEIIQRLRPSTPTSAETLSAISSLLMAKRARQSRAEPLYTSTPILPTAANVGEAIIDARVLQEAPHPMPMPEGPVGSKVAIDAALLVKVKKALQKQRQIIKNLVGQDRLDSREEDVIDIVGMLFEAMLNEKLLPNAVKTLLSHLHTRYLKIAVQSPHFLDNSDHPARRLFERMIDTGIRWVREDNLRAGIYRHLQDIVTAILKHESLEDDFFVQQIANLDNAEQKLGKLSSAAEERTLEAERGRARLDQAKAIVKRTIDDLSTDTEVSPGVITFLSTTYADYLTLLLLRSDLDTESRSWSNAYSVGEALVVAAVHAANGQPLGEKVRDDLTKRLESTVGSLIPHHEQNIRRVMDSLDQAPEKPALAAKAAREPAIATADAATTTAAPTQPLPAPPASTPVAAQASATGEAAKEADEEPPSAEDQKIADKLMREAGNWFVMQKGDDKEEQTVKLLWVNPHTRNMLFVDQHGTKVALMPATNVARLIREGTVRPMEQETSSFVARSLRRIRRALEDSVNA